MSGKTSTEVRHFIGRKKARARSYGRALRNPWRIENCLHGQMDVAFGEDARQTRERNALANFARLRRIGLSPLQQYPSKDNLVCKRLQTAGDSQFLEAVLRSSTQTIFAKCQLRVFFMRRSYRIACLVLFLLVGVALAYWLYASSEPVSPSPGIDTHSWTREAVPAHLEALKSEDPAVRKEAARALWEIGTSAPEATPALLQAIQDPAPEVRETAAKALGRTSWGSTQAVAALVQALKDQQPAVWSQAAAALHEVWLSYRPKASASQARGRPPVVEQASEFQAEGKPGDRSTADRASGPSPTLRRQVNPAVEAATREAVPALTQALRDSEASVRAHAAEALGEIGPAAEPAVPNLVRILENDPDQTARLNAAVAAGYIGPVAKATIPALIEQVRHEPFYGIRANAAASLGMIHSNPEVVVPVLVTAHLKDPESEVRRLALLGMTLFGSAAPKLALATLETLQNDPQNQQDPEFQRRAAAFREMLNKRLQAKGAPPQAKPPKKP